MNAVTSHREVIPIKFENKIFGKLSTSTLIEYENLPEDFLFRLCLNKKYGDPYLVRDLCKCIPWEFIHNTPEKGRNNLLFSDSIAEYK